MIVFFNAFFDEIGWFEFKLLEGRQIMASLLRSRQHYISKGYSEYARNERKGDYNCYVVDKTSLVDGCGLEIVESL